MPPEQYQEIIRDSRRAQLADNAEAVRRLEALLARTAAGLAREIQMTPRGLLGERYRRQLLESLNRVLDGMRDEYRGLLDAGITNAATLSAGREADILAAAYQERYGFRPDQALALSSAQGSAAIQFGTVPKVVLERLYARVYPDGLNLSQRLYNLDLEARRLIGDEVTRAIATGASSRSLATAIAPHMTAEGVDNVRYKAMRIARTEINVAYREGTVASATNPDGSLKGYISAIGFRLSASHPRICICDLYAGQDGGLGPGNYLPEDVPTAPHPHCLCYLVTILAALPDQQFTARVACPDRVPESQLKYYGALSA